MVVGLMPKSRRPTSGGPIPRRQPAHHSAATVARPIDNPNRRSPRSVSPRPVAIHAWRAMAQTAGKESSSMLANTSANDGMLARFTLVASSRQSGPAWRWKARCRPTTSRDRRRPRQTAAARAGRERVPGAGVVMTGRRILGQPSGGGQTGGGRVASSCGRRPRGNPSRRDGGAAMNANGKYERPYYYILPGRWYAGSFPQIYDCRDVPAAKILKDNYPVIRREVLEYFA